MAALNVKTYRRICYDFLLYEIYMGGLEKGENVNILTVVYMIPFLTFIMSLLSPTYFPLSPNMLLLTTQLQLYVQT